MSTMTCSTPPKTLLKRGYFIKEEVVIAAGRRKQRGDIQWDAVKEELETYFQRPLAPQSRASLRALTKAEFEPLKATKEVRDYLQNRGRGSGNETAGYGFLGWPDRAAAERLISNREHVAAGFHHSADRLRDVLNDPTLPPPQPDLLN